MKALNLRGQPVDLKVAGIHGTSDISGIRVRVRIGDQDGKVKEDIMAHGHLNVDEGNRTNNSKKLKGSISSPISFERFYYQLGRCKRDFGPRLLSPAQSNRI